MRVRFGVAVGVAVLVVAASTGAGASADKGASASSGGHHWNSGRIAAATPRDLVVDERGLGYLRRADGSLQPHAHSTQQLYAAPAATGRPTPTAKPGGGGGGDTTGPTISNLDPDGVTIGSSYPFSAQVTDSSGVKSVTFVITYPDGTTTQSFSASASSVDTWSVTLEGFTAGDWSWHVVAKDGARRGGNTSTSSVATFLVSGDGGGDDGGGGGGDGSTTVDADWTGGGTVQTAAGRIYFEMPSNPRGTRWSGYVCSGTVAEDSTTERSVIITAAHCVYDDVHTVFARNVLFIPDQDGTTGSGTDLNCGNDPMGCWSPSFGVVDTDWTTRTFPDNIPWDYAYYVVSDSGAHSGNPANDALDVAAGDLPVQFATPVTGALTHALGYSYSQDPNLRFCAEPLASESSYGDWWLGACELSGGSSGGPWMQPVDGGNGPIVSVNSWGYTNQPGMGGPPLTGSASCLLDTAKAQDLATVTGRGVTAC